MEKKRLLRASQTPKTVWLKYQGNVVIFLILCASHFLPIYSCRNRIWSLSKAHRTNFTIIYVDNAARLWI